MKTILPFLLCFRVCNAACLPVEGTRITAAHVARSVSAFEEAPPDAFVAYAAAPGMVRVVRKTELARIAQRLSVSTDALEDVCFEIPTGRLDEEQLLESLRKEMPADTKIEVVETSQYPVPKGEVVFRRNALPIALSTPPDAVLLWRGRVVYAPGASVSIWARVRVSRTMRVAVATRPIGAGVSIDAADVEYHERTVGALRTDAAPALEQITSMRLRRAVNAGAEIEFDNLVHAPLVVRGENVQVRVEGASSVIEVRGKAMSTAREGDLVAVQNPENGRTFRARVDGRGSAVVRVQ